MINPYSVRGRNTIFEDFGSAPFSGTNPYGQVSIDPSSAFTNLKTGTTGPNNSYIEPNFRVTAASSPSSTTISGESASPKGITLPNGQYIPAFSVNDFMYTPPEPQGDYPSIGFDPNYGGIYGLKPEAVSKYFPGMTELGVNNWVFQTEHGRPDLGLKSLMVKTGEKEGTIIPFTKQGDYFIPDINNITTQYWDTNSGAMNRMLLAGLAALGTAGALSPFTPAGAAPLEPWLNPLADAGLFAGGTGGAGAAAGAATGAVGSEAGGLYSAEAIPVAPPAPAVTSPLPPIPGVGTGAGDVAAGIDAATEAGLEGLATGGAGAAGGADFLSQLRQTLGPITRLMSGGGGQQPGRNVTGLGGLLAALYGQHAQAAYADKLNEIANRMQQMADPYMQKLRESYENPNAYLQSPEMQAILNLEANKLAGIDAAQGRLSNDIGRTAKLQQLAQSRLGDYRSGLQHSISTIYQPKAIAELFQQAAQSEAGRYGDLASWFGGGGSPSDVWGDIGEIIDVGGDIWDVISGWWD